MAENDGQGTAPKVVLKPSGDNNVNSSDQTRLDTPPKVEQGGAQSPGAPDGKSRRTIKLQPLPKQGGASAPAPSNIQDTVSLSKEKVEDTATKPNVKTLVAQGAAPAGGAPKPTVNATIKLRPKSGADAATPSAQTQQANLPDDDDGGNDATRPVKAHPHPSTATPQAAPAAVAATPAPASPAPASPATGVPPQNAVPGAKRTIKLRPSSAAASPDTGSGTQQTIKLKPSGQQQEVTDQTQQVPPPPAALSATPGVAHQRPSGQATIKLVPKKPDAAAATTPPPSPSKGDIDETAALPSLKPAGGGKPSLKISPKAAGGPTPSSPTIKAPSVGAPQPKPSDPTVKVEETIKHPTEQPDAAGEEGGPKKLGIRKREEAPLSPQEERASEEFKKGPDGAKKTGSDEPSIIFLLASCLTVAALGYLIFNMVMQLKLLNG